MRMVGWPGMPARAAPLTEAAVVEQLITDLKTNFGVRVNYNIMLDRSCGGEVEVATKSFVLLGGSNSDRLGDTLQAME
jgi:hypothetical protein